MAVPADVQIGGVATDATSGTVLLMDDAGRALTLGLMYDDTRAVAETRRANDAGAAQWAALGYNRMAALVGIAEASVAAWASP